MKLKNQGGIFKGGEKLLKNKKWPTMVLWNSQRDKRILKFIGLVVLIFIIVFGVLALSDDSVFSDDSLSQNTEEESDCNVVGIEIRGDLVTYISASDYDADGNILTDQTASETVVATIENAEKDETIKAILVEIDSYGGMPVAGEEISVAIKNAKKPNVALIRGAGDSAAYWAATGANRIFASKNSDVGSIGVTMSYLSAENSNKETGFIYNSLSSGKFKDSGDPDKQLTDEEKQLFMRDVNIIHQNFIQAVSQNRNLDLKKVEALADGSAMLGEMALQNGLIDQIGGMLEVNQYLKDKIGADPEICW